MKREIAKACQLTNVSRGKDAYLHVTKGPSLIVLSVHRTKSETGRWKVYISPPAKDTAFCRTVINFDTSLPMITEDSDSFVLPLSAENSGLIFLYIEKPQIVTIQLVTYLKKGDEHWEVVVRKSACTRTLDVDDPESETYQEDLELLEHIGVSQAEIELYRSSLVDEPYDVRH
jgi:hypothetical protein